MEEKIIQLLNTQRDAMAEFNSRGEDKVQFHADFQNGKLYDSYAYIYRNLLDSDGNYTGHVFFERVGSCTDIDNAIEMAQAFFDGRVAYEEVMTKRTIVGFHTIKEGQDGTP